MSALSAFAWTSSDSGTSRGRNAFSAGSENVKRVADSAITGYAIQIIPRASTSSSGTITTAWSRLANIIVRRRSQRSTKTPANDPNTICGATSDATRPAVANDDPVSS